jgi:hypothetical protein
LLVVSDSGGQVRELAAGESNNLAAGAISVGLSPYADLEVSSVNAPAATIVIRRA